MFNEGDTWESVTTGKPVALRFQIELEFGNVGFEERGKPDLLEKNLSEQGQEIMTNSTNISDAAWELKPGHIWWKPPKTK